LAEQRSAAVKNSAWRGDEEPNRAKLRAGKKSGRSRGRGKLGWRVRRELEQERCTEEELGAQREERDGQ
jgi:hypothetical protein